jgi:hypothetical protein
VTHDWGETREIWFGFDRYAGERFFAPLPEWHTEALQHNIQVARVPYWMNPGEPPAPLSFTGWLGSRSPVVILAAPSMNALQSGLAVNAPRCG